MTVMKLTLPESLCAELDVTDSYSFRLPSGITLPENVVKALENIGPDANSRTDSLA